MTNQRAINEDLERLNTLSGMMEAYQEIATNRMQRIRDSVLKNRSFLTQLDKVYIQVEASYRHELEKLKKQASNHLDKNGKTALVLVTANAGFYGDIVTKSYDLFKKELQEHPGDVFIIGRLGKALFEDQFPKTSFTYIELSDNQFSDDELKEIATQLNPYETVIIYHGLFHTILSQVPIASNITQSPDPAQLPQDNKERFFFEPSLSDVVTYFEKQIFSSNLTHALHESQLAKLASRTISLENSRTNISEELKQVGHQNLVLKHRIANKKQLNVLTGMKLWKIR